MLYEAEAWRPDSRPDFDGVFANPRIAGYIEGWGRPGDDGVIAEAQDGTRLGAAWYRLFTEEQPGLGFVSPSVPELSIAVAPSARGLGIGTRLLTTLIDRARRGGYQALSLSVEVDNPAARLYERFSFVRVSPVGNAWIMKLDL
jgi:ribosomal protein S18 acetylase RimI-like enzyme